MTERSPAEFLARSGWSTAKVTPLPGDASTRHYARLTANGRSALLMDQPQNAESPPASEQAAAAERKALGYNAVARLAGADTKRFAAVAEHLRHRGLAAPQIHAADHTQGFVVLEDFGDTLYADRLLNGASEPDLYKAAVEVLAKLHAKTAPNRLASDMPLYDFDQTALLAETDLFTEWFLPLALGRPASAAEQSEHRALWRAVLSPPEERVLVHRDFHAQNLMWMPERQGHGRVGLIDFQDAVAGSRTYDLVSLTEDARRDVSPAVAEFATAHYLQAALAQGARLNEASFRAEMAVMAAQRNTKIAGIFARLYLRDHKPRYLALLPRVWDYLERDLSHPSLAKLGAWYDRTIPKHRRVPVADAGPEKEKV